MAAANAHHRCGTVNQRSKQSRFYVYGHWAEYVGIHCTNFDQVMEELISKTSYIHSHMLLICIIDFLLQLK